jgi:hypothetical protein
MSYQYFLFLLIPVTSSLVSENLKLILPVFSYGYKLTLGPIQNLNAVVTGGLLRWGKSGRGVKLTIHVNVVQWLRIHGAILPLPQYVFMM